VRDLIQQERFEMEVLDRMNSGRFLDRLLFTGGTMLRLCHGLERFSVDLDFRLRGGVDAEAFFTELNDYLGRSYQITDAADKYNTLLLELKSSKFPRRLKLEIRKHGKDFSSEQAIAYSIHSTLQVLLRVVTLQEMMASKIDAFLERQEIRDAYDLEFLVKKGVIPEAPTEKLLQVSTLVKSLPPQDYNVKLSSLLEEDLRQYYREQNFKILLRVLDKVISN
jgi:predicted nucleotidyltransferase component of viral defense system